MDRHRAISKQAVWVIPAGFVRGFAVLGLLGLPFWACQAANLHTSATVNFGESVEVISQSGVLEGVSADDAKYEPIVSSTEWARNFSSYTSRVQKMLDLGYSVIVRLDDFQRRNNGMMPYEDWAAWENYVRERAQEWGTQVVYGVWNEPDLDIFWSGTEAEYHEAYRRAHDVLKDELGADARLSGPSVHRWNPDYIERFLDFCLANDLTVDVLQWHALNQSDDDIPSVQTHLETARADWVDASSYSAVGIEKIVLGETVGQDRTYNPGSTLGYFYYAEKGGSDGAASSCWNNDCENGSISGLLDGPNGERRAVWWTFNAYADGVGARVDSSTQDERIVALGSRGTPDTNGNPQVVVGYFKKGSTPDRANVELNLDNLDATPALQDAEAVRIRVEKLPANGPNSLDAPIFTSETTYDLVDGGVTLTLRDIGLEEAAIVSIEPAESNVGSIEFISRDVHTTSSDDWDSVSFASQYDNPVVIASPPSYAGGQPATVRIRNVGATGCEIQIDEWSYLDGAHAVEQVGLMVMEEGVFELDGKMIEAGIASDVNHNFKTVELSHGGFDGSQIVLAQTVTYDGPAPVATRVRRNPSHPAERFDVKVQEEEGADGWHARETVHYVALPSDVAWDLGAIKMSSGSTGDSLTHEWSASAFGDSFPAPTLLAGMQTYHGGNTAALRYRNLSSTSVEMKVEEERSADSEIAHTTEEAGYVAIGDAFAPEDIPGLRMWLDGQDGASVVESSGDVSRWEDKADGSNDVTQGVSSYRPSYETAINGKSAVVFDGGNDDLRIESSVRNGIGGATIFVVHAAPEASSWQRVVGAYSGSGDSWQEPNWEIIRSSTQAYAPRLTVKLHDDVIVDDSIVLGRSAAGTWNYFNGAIGEILIYDRQLTARQQSEVESYLKRRWGL